MKITRKHFDAFLSRYATDERVLDIGAGWVSTNHSYTKYFPNRHTVDIDSSRKPDTVADIHALPFSDSSEGYIVSTEVLEHCHDPKTAIAEIYRVLRPGGTLVLTTRFVYPLHDTPHDYFRFTKYGLQKLFEGWEIVELIPETATFSALGALLQRIGFQTELRGGKLTKAIVYCVAHILQSFDGLIRAEYGDIGRTKADDHIMTTGYYLVARKK